MDEAAPLAREDELRSGGLHLEFSCAFVLGLVERGAPGCCCVSATMWRPCGWPVRWGSRSGWWMSMKAEGMLRGNRVLA
jgi:hypothetical protein